jgi:hypothetical protein
VRLGNKRAETVVHLEPFAGIQRGVVIVEGLFPNSSFETGMGINVLIGDDAAPPNGGGVFHDAAVWLRGADDEA